MTDADQITKVAVRLLEEGVNAARWVPAKKLKENIYKLFPTQNYDPEDETWEFLPGSIVRCEVSDEFAEPCLLAVEKMEENVL